MAANYLITPLTVQSGELNIETLITKTSGFSDSSFISSQPTSGSQQKLFLEDGNQSIEIGTRTLSGSRLVTQKIAMNGKKAAWDSYEAGGTKIKYFDGTRTIDLGNGIEPHFYKQGIVWGNQSGLQYYNGQTTQQLSNIPSGLLSGLEVSGNNIAWIGSNGTNSQLYFYNGSTTKQISIGNFNNGSRRDGKSNFEISGNQVVWNSSTLLTDGTQDPNIYYFDGTQSKQLTNTPNLEIQASLYQGKPIWTGFDNNNIQQVFIYENGKTKQITNAQSTIDGQFTVVDGLVAWIHYDAAKDQTDIYTYNGTKVVNLTSTPGVSEFIDRPGLTDRLYWKSDAGQFGYINGQVQQLNLGDASYGLTAGTNGNLLLQGFDTAENSFAGTYRGTVFDSNLIQRGTAEDDRLMGTRTNNIIYGLDNDDFITGGSGTDNLYGGNGDDKIDGKGGNDLVLGGAGDDIIDGAAGNDILVGGNGSDTLRGGIGNDSIYGDMGDDYIEGGDGNDKINGGLGNDEIYAGNGNDIIDDIYDLANIHGGAGNDEISADGGEIYGDAGNDSIISGGNSILIKGGDGNDIIDNFAGVSGSIGELYGDAGNDKIVGGNGTDELLGGSGNDTLTGGNGNDILTGDAGSDTFVFSGFGAGFSAEIGLDQITDFNVATDKIRLERGFNEIGDIFTTTIKFAAVAQDSDVASNSALIVYSKDSGGLFYNANGAAAGLGNGSEFAILENQPQNLVASSFTIV